MYFVAAAIELFALLIRSLFAVFWAEMISRTTGPLAFRFLLQLLMASALAACDGLKESRLNRTPFLSTVVKIRSDRQERLLEGLSAVSRVIFIAIGIEFLCQYVALNLFRPLQAIVVGVALACLLYLVVWGPANRLSRGIHLVRQLGGKVMFTGRP